MPGNSTEVINLLSKQTPLEIPKEWVSASDITDLEEEINKPVVSAPPQIPLPVPLPEAPQPLIPPELEARSPPVEPRRTSRVSKPSAMRETSRQQNPSAWVKRTGQTRDVQVEETNDNGDDAPAAMSATAQFESILNCGMNDMLYGPLHLDLDEALEFAFNSGECASALKASSHDNEPRTFREAMQRPPAESVLWQDAAMKEIQALVENGTFELVQLPPGRKAIGSRWVFKVKRNADGSIERYKGRLVAQGFSQRPGFDYTETFAPTPKWASLRAILALAALEDLELDSVDISSAFLNGELHEEVYMRQPEGFEQRGNDWVWRLLKSLYGLKQAGRVWHEKLHSVLSSMGFERIICEHSVWVFQRHDVRIIIPVFIDDMTIATKSKEDSQRVKEELKKHFKLRDLGPTSWLLGVEIKRDRANHILSLSQKQYALDVLKRFGHSDCSPVLTPLEPGARLSTSMSPQTQAEIDEMRDIPYVNAVGSLAYLAVATRPDLAYAVGVLARFSSNPGMQHWKACKHVFRYLKGTIDQRLIYGPVKKESPELFEAFSDADHAGNPDSGRSTTGMVITMGTGAVSWSSRLQSIVALSTTEAEYVAACTAGQEILWLRNFLGSLGYKFDAPSTLYMDNQSAVQVAKNPEHHGRMKHLDLRFYWLRNEVEKGRMRFVHIGTDKMPADIMTKALGRLKVEGMRHMLGLAGSSQEQARLCLGSW